MSINVSVASLLVAQAVPYGPPLRLGVHVAAAVLFFAIVFDLYVFIYHFIYHCICQFA